MIHRVHAMQGMEFKTTACKICVLVIELSLCLEGQYFIGDLSVFLSELF